MPLIYRNTKQLRAVWQITESTDCLLSQTGNADIYRGKMEFMKPGQRQQEWLASRLLINILSGKDAVVAYRENGAPYLENSNLNVSISHTKGYVAALLQEMPFAGVDIERKSSRILKIKDRLLSSSETGMIDHDNKENHILICWCAKEALFKMIPEEGIDFREHLHIEPFLYSESGDIHAYESRSKYHRQFKLSYEVTPDYAWVWSNG